MKAMHEESVTPLRVGKSAAIIGGGNVAMAAARCAVKVAKKRCARAQKKIELAKTEVYIAQDHLKKMEDYEQDAYNELREAISNLTEIETRR